MRRIYAPPAAPAQPLLPGSYLRQRREAAGRNLQDIALALDTEPAISCRSRVELLEDIEAGRTPVDAALIVALRFAPLRIDPGVLTRLVAIEAGAMLPHPQLCRRCACSYIDPCLTAGHGPCGWAEPDLCTRCSGDDGPDDGDGGDALPVPGNDVAAVAIGAAA